MPAKSVVLELLDRLQLGGALLDAAGTVREINASAERIVAAHQPAKGGAQRRSPPLATRAIRRLFGPEVTRPAHGLATARDRVALGPRPIIACTLPLPDGGGARTGAMIVMVDLNLPLLPSAAILATAFSLTRAEAQMAADLAAGKSLRAIAQRRKVTIMTMRAHLKSVLAKTRTHRQAELVALLSRLPPLM